MTKIEQGKLLGGIGSILELIPGVAIVGYILVLIGVKYISDELQDRAIFNNMLYAAITGIIAAITGVGIFALGSVFSLFTMGMGGFVGIAGFLLVAWIALIISSIFIRRSFGALASRLNVGSFRTAGTLYFVGAILTIVLVGFIILLVAYIFQIIAFFSIKDAPQPYQAAPAPSPMPVSTPAPPPAEQSVKYCPSCGAQLDETAKFCRSCGKPV